MKYRKLLVSLNALILFAILFSNIDEITFVLVLGLISINLYLIYHSSKLDTSLHNQNTDYQSVQDIKEENTIVKQRFFNLAQNLKSGVLSIDTYGYITYSNLAFSNMFQIELTQNIKIHDLSNQTLKKILLDAYGKETYLDTTLEFENNHYKITINPVFTKTGNFMGLLLISTNITNLVRAEVMQKAFIADVSHELKTPISAIKFAGDLLKNPEDLKADDQYEIFQIIIHEISRIEHLVQDILDLSQFDRLDFKLNMSNVDIKDIIDTCIKSLKGTAEQKHITIINEATHHLLRLDEKRITQTILNLIKNAIMYTDVGLVRIKTKESQRTLEIIIEDTGIGISKHDLSKIYDRFYRVDKNRSRSTGGSGLGLSITKEIIEKHDGSIEILSRVGKGTKVKITLPLDYVGQFQ